MISTQAESSTIRNNVSPPCMRTVVSACKSQFDHLTGPRITYGSIQATRRLLPGLLSFLIRIRKLLCELVNSHISPDDPFQREKKVPADFRVFSKYVFSVSIILKTATAQLCRPDKKLFCARVQGLSQCSATPHACSFPA